MKDTTILNGRITVIDALRGFALLGVVLVHMQQHYSYFGRGPFLPHEPFLAQWDEASMWLVMNVMVSRFINIFAFLFGMSFFIQMDRAKQKGISFRGRFLWRMVILFVIGVIGSCFYSGDILSIYAVFGVILLFLDKFKNWVLILIAVLLLGGVPRMMMMGYDKLTASPATEQVEQQPSRPRDASVRRQAPPKPSFWRTAKNNLTFGTETKLDYQFNPGNRGYLTLAIFIFGLVVGRSRFFETLHLKKRRNWILLAGFVAGVCLTNWLIGFFPPQGNLFWMMSQGHEPSMGEVGMEVLNDVNMVLFSGMLGMAFIVLYQMKGVGKVLGVLAPYGRMGLTNYVSQSIIGAFLFAMWAFGERFGAWHTTEILLLGLGVYIVQVIISKVWLTYFQYGPLEWAWRSLTYFKIQPLWKR